jgi:predicted RND superfamily exporter protein
MNIYADIFGRSRILIALLAILVSGFAGYGFSHLTIDDVPRKLFASDDDDYHRLEQLFKDFGSDDNDCVVVLESDDLFTPTAVDVIRNIGNRCRSIEGIAGVQSLADVTVFPKNGFPRAMLPVQNAPENVFVQSRRDAANHPLVKGQLLSNDGRMTLVFARIKGDLESIEEVQPIVESIQQIVNEETKGKNVLGSVTGIPALRSEVIQSLRRIQLRYTVLGVVIAFCVGIFVFRKPSAVIIVTLPPFIGVFWMLGTLGFMGEKLNVVNSVMPPMILVIAFTDSVHLLSSIREARSQGMSRLEACQWAIRHVGLACFMASFTTAIGFGSLLVANVATIRDMGVDTAIGVMIGFFSTMTLVPLLASTQLGDNLVLRGNQGDAPKPVAAIVRLLATVVTWPKTVAIIGTIVTLYLGYTTTFLQPDNRLTETLPTDSEAYQTMARCDEAFGGVLMVHAVIDWPESMPASSPELIRVLDEVHDIFGKDAPRSPSGEPFLAHPLSILNVMRTLPGNVDRNARMSLVLQHLPGLNLLVPPTLVQRFVREDLHRAIVSAHVRDIGSQVYQPIFRDVQAKLGEIEKRHPGFKLGLTGTTVVASLKIQDMITSMNSGLITAAIIIFGTMALAFRSLLLGMLCIIPNLFPLVLVASGLVWLGQPLQLATVIVFNIGIGMTVDNTIHLVTRFQHEFPVDWNLKDALRRTGLAIGNPLLSTVVVLLAGFGSLMTSSIPVTRLFSVLACAILATALIGDLILLPAFIACFVRPPRKQSRGAISHSPSPEENGPTAADPFTVETSEPVSTS